MNQSKQSGIVLVTTMMIITLLALFTLSQLQLLSLNIKTLNLLKAKHKAFSTLETAAAKIIPIIDLATCLVSEQDPRYLVDLLANKKGCVLSHEKRVFYYLIEDLGLFPCLQGQFKNQKFSMQHLRISLLSAEKKQAGFLQLRFARFAKLMPCEHLEPREAKTGIISWRYFIFTGQKHVIPSEARDLHEVA